MTNNAEIRARLEAATPERWEQQDRYGRPHPGSPSVTIRYQPSMEAVAYCGTAGNAALVAHAPTDIAFLLEENERLYSAGYRLGFDSGRMAAMRERQSLDNALSTLAASPVVKHAPRKSGPKCVDCGHAFTTHNELGYCQARGKRGSDGCHCNYAMGAEERARIDASNREREGGSDV